MVIRTEQAYYSFFKKDKGYTVVIAPHDEYGVDYYEQWSDEDVANFITEHC